MEACLVQCDTFSVVLNGIILYILSKLPRCFLYSSHSFVKITALLKALGVVLLACMNVIDALTTLSDFIILSYI